MEHQLETEQRARRNATKNAANAVDLAGALRKIENSLYQATDVLRQIESYLEAVMDDSQVQQSNVRDAITIE